MVRRHGMGGGGFSLVELLVVIAIVAVMMSVLLPTLSLARETARDAACKSNQRQLGVASMNYRNDFQVYLPSYQTQTDDPNVNTGAASLPQYFGNSGQGLLHAAGYITFAYGLYSSSASASKSGQLEAARRSTVTLCPSGKYWGPAQALGAMAYVISPGEADGMDSVTRTQDGYDVSRVGTTIKSGTYDPLTAYIQSYAVNSRFSQAILVPGSDMARTGYTAVKQITPGYSESRLLVWAEFFQRDGLSHSYRISMANLRGVSSEYSMPRWAYFRTPHGSLRTGNWSAMDGHVASVRVDELQRAWSAASTTLAAQELPFEF